MKQRLSILFLSLVASVGIICAQGIGANLTYKKSVDTLIISGTGEMRDFFGYGSNDNAPWVTNYPYGSDIKHVVVSEGVTRIGNYAFYSLRNLKSVTIPKSVISVGRGILAYCDSYIKSHTTADGTLYINDCLVFINTGVFNGNIKEGTRVIAEQLTSASFTLDSITIPKTVKYIGSDAFWGVFHTKTKYTGDIENWLKITFGNGSSNPICQSHNLYINEQKIEDLVIPNTIDTINAHAFRNWHGKSITLGRDLQKCGNAFYGCDSIKYIISKSVVPPSIGTVFSSNPLCYIPCGTLNAYFGSKWKESCYQFIEQSSVYDITLLTNNSYGIAKVASRPDCNSAILTAIPNEGCTFVKWSDGNTQATRYLEVTKDINLTAYVAKEGYTIHVYQDCNTTIE